MNCLQVREASKICVAARAGHLSFHWDVQGRRGM